MNIYLIGYMASGKTTIGKALAVLQKKTFLDLDAFIEQQEGMAIAQIFATAGEAAFREMERRHLHHTFLLENHIISVGGGAPCFFDNIEQMNLHGFPVYLQMSAQALTERLWGLPPAARASRPLIAGKTKEQLAEFIDNTLQKRGPFYSKARLIVDNEGNDINLTAERINMAFKHLTK